MGIMNYKEASLALEKRTYEIEVGALHIQVYDIPEEGYAGGLDPRVEKSKDEDAKKPPRFTPDMTMEQVREAMGTDNIDLTQGHIETSYKNIPGRHGDVPVRIYTPKGVSKLPCLIYYHGGGFIGGKLDSFENPCKLLAEKSASVVISVDYRLAPENPFPIGLEDSYDVVSWVYDNAETIHVDKMKIGVCGDSAGGNMATVCTLKDREDNQEKIKYQALIYPSVDCGGVQPNYTWDMGVYEVKRDHERVNAEIKAFGNSQRVIDTYLSNDESLCKTPHVAPLMADDVSDFPRTIIINAEYDALRQEGEAYGKKLKEAGVEIRMIRYNGIGHAYIDKLGIYPQAEHTIEMIASDFVSHIHK